MRKSPASPRRTQKALIRNLLVLGSISLLVLGGLGVLIASRKTGDNHVTTQTISNEVTNNYYFQQLIASGAATEKDLEAVTGIRPHGTGFMGITKEEMTWKQAEALAGRAGARILVAGDNKWNSPEALENSLSEMEATSASAPLWVSQAGKSCILTGTELFPTSALEQPRRALVEWGNEAGPSAEPVKLFDGKSLSGWKVIGDETAFSVVDGTIRARGANSHLVYVGRNSAAPSWRDLDLTFKVKTESRGNSGVWIHVQDPPPARTALAMEVQIDNETGEARKTGSLWAIKNVSRQYRRDGEWFGMRVVVKSSEIEVFIDGELVNRWTQPPDWQPPADSPAARLGAGTIGLQSFGGEVWFKDIEVLVPDVIDSQNDAWIEMFDGDTLTGWETRGDDNFSAGKGEIHARGSGPPLVFTKKRLTDFEIELDVRTNNRGNSGLFIHTDEKGDGDQLREIQIASPGATGTRGRKTAKEYHTGSVFDDPATGASTVPAGGLGLSDGEWIKLGVRVEGNWLSTTVNGQAVANTVRPPGTKSDGYLALQARSSEGGSVDFRNLRLREGSRSSRIAFVNGLGMSFVSVEGTSVLFCIWETRVKDYEAFAKGRILDDRWKKDVSLQNHPVSSVSWDDANEFCEWLTSVEVKEGRISPGSRYRLPTDEEWSRAVALPAETGETPVDRHGRNDIEFPWGIDYPPTRLVGNYADVVWAGDMRKSGRPWEPLIAPGYHDWYAATAPVATYPPNRYGIYDLGGNVWEWCEDLFDPRGTNRTMRGASYVADFRGMLLSSARFQRPPDHRGVNTGFRCVLEKVDPVRLKN